MPVTGTMVADTVRPRSNFPVAYGSEIHISETDSRTIPEALGDAGQKASKTEFGVMKVGDGLDVEVSTNPNTPNPDAGLVSLHKATDTEIGGVIVKDGIDNDEGAISVPYYTIVSSEQPTDHHRLWIDTSVSHSYNEDAFEIKNYNNYSEEEIVCGRWIDGKPIYRKVLTIVPNTKDYSFVHNIPIEKPLNCYGFVNAQGNDLNTFANYFSMTQYSSACWLNRQRIRVLLGTDALSALINMTVILEYTKTTDAPGSFTEEMMVNGMLDHTVTEDDIEEVLG